MTTVKPPCLGFTSNGLTFLLLQQIYASEKDFSSACRMLGAGADYAVASNSQYTTLLFLLSKGMVSRNDDLSGSTMCH